MDKLFPSEYVQGYTAALIDVKETLDCIQQDLKIHKRRQNYKTYKAIVECMIKGRVFLRENPKAFVRCNDTIEGGFEIYCENKLRDDDK